MRTYKIYSVSNVKIYRIVLLTIATILYIRLPEIFHLINWKFVPLTTITHSSTPSPRRPSVYLLCSMRHLPGPGMELTSRALADRLLTTGPTGKSLLPIFNSSCFIFVGLKKCCINSGYLFLMSYMIFKYFLSFCGLCFHSVNFLWKWKWKLLSCVWLFATPWTIQSMEFYRPEYWSG